MRNMQSCDVDDGVHPSCPLTPLCYIEAIADDPDLSAGIDVEADDVMILRQANCDPATDQSRRAGDQYSHVPPRSIASFDLAH